MVAAAHDVGTVRHTLGHVIDAFRTVLSSIAPPPRDPADKKLLSGRLVERRRALTNRLSLLLDDRSVRLVPAVLTPMGFVGFVDEVFHGRLRWVRAPLYTAFGQGS